MTSNTGIHTGSGNKARWLKPKIISVTIKNLIRNVKAQNEYKKSLCKRKIKKVLKGNFRVGE